MSLEKAGVPSCTVVTEVFAGKARREAEALGMDALPILVIPHPVGQLSRDQMRAITDQHLDDILACLSSPASELTLRFTRRRGV